MTIDQGSTLHVVTPIQLHLATGYIPIYNHNATHITLVDMNIFPIPFISYKYVN